MINSSPWGEYILDKRTERSELGEAKFPIEKICIKNSRGCTGAKWGILGLLCLSILFLTKFITYFIP